MDYSDKDNYIILMLTLPTFATEMNNNDLCITIGDSFMTDIYNSKHFQGCA